MNKERLRKNQCLVTSLVKLEEGTTIRLLAVAFDYRLCGFTEVDRDKRLLQNRRVAAKIESYASSPQSWVLETVAGSIALEIIAQSSVTYELLP